MDKKRNFYYIKRIVDRTPPGTEMVVGKCGERVRSIFGDLKGTGSYVLKHTDSDCCVAFSTDVEDLVLFAIEHDWWFNGPDHIVEMAATLAELRE